METSRGRGGADVHTIRVLRLRGVVVSGEGLGGRVPGREWGAVVALCGGVGVVQPNVGLKRTGVNTYPVEMVWRLQRAEKVRQEQLYFTFSKLLRKFLRES